MADSLGPLHDWQSGDEIAAADMQAFTDRLRGFPITFSGNVVVSRGSDGSIHVHVNDPPATGPEWIWVKITGYLAMSGADNRWQYSWHQQRMTATGWEDVPDGLTGTTDTRFAINSIEANNSASGVQGNGVNVDTLPSGFSLQPIQGGPVVQLWLGSDTDGNATYTFSLANGVDGECP